MSSDSEQSDSNNSTFEDSSFDLIQKGAQTLDPYRLANVKEYSLVDIISNDGETSPYKAI